MIIDASVMVDALITTGDLGDRARAALNPDDLDPSEELHAPGHFPLEVTSALSRLVRAQAITTERMRAALTDATDFGVVLNDITPTDMLRTVDLPSLRVADALYVALAERLGEPLMTNDARIGKSGASISCRVLSP